MGRVKQLCAHCVELPAVKTVVYGRAVKLCVKCWRFYEQHGRLPKPDEGGPRPHNELGGIGVRGQEKPRLDQLEKKLK